MEETKTETPQEETEETQEPDKETIDSETLTALNSFAQKMKGQIDELREVAGEHIIMKDESSGFSFESKSQKFNAIELSNLALQSFKAMRELRPDKKVLGVG